MPWSQLHVRTEIRRLHYGDVIMNAIASQITSLTVVYSTVYSDADQRKHQSSASLASVRGVHRGPVNSTHKWPVTRKMFPFDDVIMLKSPLNIQSRLVRQPRKCNPNSNRCAITIIRKFVIFCMVPISWYQCTSTDDKKHLSNWTRSRGSKFHFPEFWYKCGEKFPKIYLNVQLLLITPLGLTWITGK